MGLWIQSTDSVWEIFSLRRSWELKSLYLFHFSSSFCTFYHTKSSFHHVPSLLPFATTKWCLCSSWISEFHLPWQSGECKSTQLLLQSWPQSVPWPTNLPTKATKKVLSTAQTSWWAVFENLKTAVLPGSEHVKGFWTFQAIFFGGKKKGQSPEHQAPPTTSEFRSNHSSSLVLQLLQLVICGKNLFGPIPLGDEK